MPQLCSSPLLPVKLHSVAFPAARAFCAAPSSRYARRTISAPAQATPPHLPSTDHDTALTPQQLAQRLVAAVAAAALTLGAVAPPDSLALLSSPNLRLARTADAALRRSIPAANPVVKEVQEHMEVGGAGGKVFKRNCWNWLKLLFGIEEIDWNLLRGFMCV